MLGGARGISFLNRKAEAARMPRHFQKGGVIQPELADERLRPDTNWFYDPREKEFSPEEELKYQFRDKLGIPVPVQHFAKGGEAWGEQQWVPPGQLSGANMPDDYLTNDYTDSGPTNSPNNPQPPYVGYYGGTDDNPTHSWMPDEYRNYWSQHGGDDGEMTPSQRLDRIANSREGQSGHWDRFRGWVSDDGRDGGDSGDRNNDSADSSDFSGYKYGTGNNLGQSSAYDPSYPYGSPNAAGSGGPTQRFAGMLGNLLGAGAGSLIPGGSLIGGKLGGIGVRMLARMFQNQGANKPPAGYGGGQSGGGGGSHGGLFDNMRGPGATAGGMFGGLPQGFKESGRESGSPGERFSNLGAPTFVGPGDFGPNFTGDSIFGGRTNLSMALPGSFAGLGSQGGDLGSIGSKLAQGQFQNWQQNPLTQDQWGDYQHFLQPGSQLAQSMGGPGVSYGNYLNNMAIAQNVAANGGPQGVWGGQGSVTRGPNSRQMNSQ
jgi:hypothetical protein